MEKKDMYIRNICLTICILLLSYTVIKIIAMIGNVVSVSVLFNQPNEVRDYVSFRLTKLIMEGQNPYTLDVLSDGNVPFMYMYTALEPLIVAGVCKMTGFSVIAGYYFINILLVVLTTFNVWQIVKDNFSSYHSIYLVCVGINTATFFAMFWLPIFNFRPDVLGIFILSCIMLVVHKNEELILLLAMMSVLLLFTKQILVVMACPLFVYYFLTNRKLAWKYLTQCIICGLITLVVIQVLFPMYWTETIYSMFLTNMDYGSIYSSIYNLAKFTYRYIAWFLLIFAGVIGILYYESKSGHKVTIIKVIEELVNKEKYILFLILNIGFGIVFLLYFAKCGGDGLKYCQDILALSCFVLFLFIWAGYFEKYLTMDMKNIVLKRSIIITSVCIVSVFTYSIFRDEFYTRADIDQYIQLNNVISEHEDEQIFLSMNVTGYLVDKDLWDSENVYFDDGQMEFFNVDFPKNKMFNRLFYNEEIEDAAKEYVCRVNDMVQNREFQLITTSAYSFIDADVLNENYYMCDTYNIKTDVEGQTNVDIWLPKN